MAESEFTPEPKQVEQPIEELNLLRGRQRPGVNRELHMPTFHSGAGRTIRRRFPSPGSTP
jgi:hypothetical protein